MKRRARTGRRLRRNPKYEFTRVEIDAAFGRLERALGEHSVPTEKGGRRYAKADEFQLMHQNEDGSLAFKHNDTRNYLFVLAGGKHGRLWWPVGGAFSGGTFDVFERPAKNAVVQTVRAADAWDAIAKVMRRLDSAGRDQWHKAVLGYEDDFDAVKDRALRLFGIKVVRVRPRANKAVGLVRPQRLAALAEAVRVETRRLALELAGQARRQKSQLLGRMLGTHGGDRVVDCEFLGRAHATARVRDCLGRPHFATEHTLSIPHRARFRETVILQDVDDVPQLLLWCPGVATLHGPHDSIRALPLRRKRANDLGTHPFVLDSTQDRRHVAARVPRRTTWPAAGAATRHG